MFSDLYELANKYDRQLSEMEGRFDSLGSRYEGLRKITDA
jgi:hypothetical protein